MAKTANQIVAENKKRSKEQEERNSSRGKRKKKESKGSFKEARMDFIPASTSEKIKAETKERMAQAEYNRYKTKEKPVYDAGKYTNKGISFSYAEKLADADYEKSMKTYEEGVQRRKQNTIISGKQAERQRDISKILNRKYVNPEPDLSIEAVSTLRKNANNRGESLYYTQLYNQKVLAHYADVFAHTRMDGRYHSVLDELKLLAIMDNGREKKNRKAAVLRKMEELGMKDGLNEQFYPHFAGDGGFDLDTFGKWLGFSAGAGLTGFSKSVADTADVLLGNTLKGVGWEDNPVSQWAEYENSNYASWQYNKSLFAEKLGGGGWNLAGDAAEATVGAVPQLILAMMTSGASTEATVGNLTTKAAYETGNVLTKAGITAETMMKNPQYWLSFSRTLGSDYKEAKEMGANDYVAAVGSVLTSLLNAGIEIGPDGMSGIQGLPSRIADAKELKRVIPWVKSALQEGGEEGLQKFVNELAAKYLYGSEEPILVPGEYARDMGLGVITGAVLGGGEVALDSTANYFAEKNWNSAWRNAGYYAGGEGMSAMDSLTKAGLSGSEALAQSTPGDYALSIQDARSKGAAPEQAFKYATAVNAMKLVTENTPIDALLDSMGSDPKRAARIMDDALKQQGIRMTNEELRYLGSLAAIASARQQDASFATEIALGLAQGYSYEQAQTMASETVWQRTLDREIVSSDQMERLLGKNPIEMRGDPVSEETRAHNQELQREYMEFKDVLGENMTETLEDFENIKYNDPEQWEKLKSMKEQTSFVGNAPCLTTLLKYTGYFLKSGTDHAEEFFNVGYTQDNPLQLRYDMAQQFDMEKAVEETVNKKGEKKFSIFMDLGVTKKKRFRTVWQIDQNSDKPRIITAYRENEKK